MDLRNHFLLAMPTLEDPNFQRTLTLIVEHNEHGAMGLVVNRPMTVSVGEILQHLEITPMDLRIGQQPVFYGGPVEPERGFILHSPLGKWEGTLEIDENTGVTTSRDILEHIARGEGPERILVTLGYSGWGAGQLEAEVAQNSWLTGPASSDILFNVPAEERLTAAAEQIGVNLDMLSPDAGHA